jgi:hypothetical protein
MKKYFYVQCYVTRQTGAAFLLTPLVEAATGTPQSDVVPPITPDMLHSRGIIIEATDRNDAFTIGGKKLGRPSDAITMNDWVYELTKESEMQP